VHLVVVAVAATAVAVAATAVVVAATAAVAVIVAPVPVVGKIAAMEAVRPVAVTAVAELLAVATSQPRLTEVVLKRVDAVGVVVVRLRTMVVAAAMAEVMTTAVTEELKVE
jgi:hypothetical protein